MGRDSVRGNEMHGATIEGPPSGDTWRRRAVAAWMVLSSMYYGASRASQTPKDKVDLQVEAEVSLSDRFDLARYHNSASRHGTDGTARSVIPPS